MLFGPNGHGAYGPLGGLDRQGGGRWSRKERTTTDGSDGEVVGGGHEQAAGKTMRRLLDLARPERYLLILSAVMMGLNSAVSLAVPRFSGRIIDLSIAPSDDDDDGNGDSPLRLLMTLLGVMTLSGFFGYFRILWQATAGHLFVARLRRRLYAAVLSQDAAFFDATRPGDVLSRMSSDADLVQSAVTDKVVQLLRNAVMSVGAVAMLLITSAKLAAVAIAVLPPVAVAARWAGRRLRDRYQRVRELHATATEHAEQALTCIRTVQQFNAEGREARAYARVVDAAHAESVRNARLSGLFRSVMGLVLNLSLLVVLGYGGALVKRGELTPGDLAGFVMYAVMMGANVSGISSQFIDLMKAIAAADRVFEIVDRIPAMPPPSSLLAELESELTGTDPRLGESKGPGLWSGAAKASSLEMAEIGGGRGGGVAAAEKGDVRLSMGAKESDGNGDSALCAPVTPMSVEFADVAFSYPTRPESIVLDGLNLRIEAGQVVALVGGSGAGKSTIACLLTRLYDPTSGAVRIDGDLATALAPAEVRRRVGIVVQEPLLFPDTIAANIRYGAPGAPDARVREAARRAFVADFADGFPDGLGTLVGPRGTQLSGGQKQRVAVARCILKDPPVVVFDEATSALDAESESKVQEAIDTACRGRTVVMIAHRLSTVRNADAIAVLQDGKIAEMGTFDELVAREGAFRNLMEKQLLVQ